MYGTVGTEAFGKMKKDILSCFNKDKLEIDEMGLDDIDRKILETMIIKYNGRPISIETVATTIGEDAETVEDMYEPYLIQIGFLARTARGRIAMPAAYSHIGVTYEE